jgi:hypothetical protein
MDSIPDGDNGKVVANAICLLIATNDDLEANARLIAAAPDLLEALQSARAMLVLMGVNLSDHEEGRKIDAAISKAEGK